MSFLVPFGRNNKLVQGKYNNLFDMDRVFDNFFNDTVFPSYYNNSGQMKVDIKELPKEYVLEAELPGVKKEDIKIHTENNRFTISVEHDERTEEKNENYIKRERRVSSMARSFEIENIVTDKISAKHENGVLTVTLPKNDDTKPTGRKINIE